MSHFSQKTFLTVQKIALIGIFGIVKLVEAQGSCSWNFKANPDDCGTYFHCDFGNALLRYCPEGLHWNTESNTCDWVKNAQCHGTGELDNNHLTDGVNNRDNQCADQSVQFMPNPEDCSKYFVCNHGSALEMTCSEPLHWNNAISSCDWPQNANCDSKPTAQPPPGSSTVTIIDGSSTAGPPAPPDETGETGEEFTTPEISSTTTSAPGPGSEDPTIYPIILGPATTTTRRTTTVGPPAPPPVSSDDTCKTCIQDEPKYKVICYFTGWSWYRPGEGKFSPSNVDVDLCTHFVYAFAILDRSTWTIRPADPWADIDNKFYKQITDLKKKGRKVTIAIGGWRDSEPDKYSLLLRDPVKISKFIKSCVDFVEEHNFDGVDLDYEYPSCPHGECHSEFDSDKNGFIALVRGLREALPPGSVLSAAVSCNKHIIDRGYHVPTLSKYLDWIGVMDYDIHGSWESKTGHIAPLYNDPLYPMDHLNVNYSLNYWISKGAEPSKIIMGIPFYGQAFTLAKPFTHSGLMAPAVGAGAPGRFSRQSGILSYYEICTAKWEKHVQDPEGRMGPYAVRGNQWVSYDDVDFIKKKMDYVKKNKLGGAMAWALDFDDFANRCGQGKYPLLSAIRNSLNQEKNSSAIIETKKKNDDDNDKLRTRWNRQNFNPFSSYFLGYS